MVKEISLKLVLVITSLLFFTLSFETFTKLVNVWYSSNTYGHGFIIVPIVLWLLSKKKEQIKALPIKTSFIGLLGVLGVSLFWFLAKLSGINVAEQFAVFITPSFVVMSIWGLSGLRLLAFPLFFLLFSVPVGDFLIPYLQFITADISVFFLELLNIPVYRDGMFIQIPNGNFLVAEACSGIRFLISTITIGVLFAYLNITSTNRRIIFIILCLLIPILANGLRAFLMILIGYLSDMQAAVGFDHLVYGWVFFSFVMVILFFIGNYIAEPISKGNSEEKTTIKSDNHFKNLNLPFFIILLLTMSVGAIVNYFHTSKLENIRNQYSKLIESEKVEKYNVNWSPNFKNADRAFYKEIIKTKRAELFVFEFFFEDDNKELISGENVLFDKNIWSLDSISKGIIVNQEGVEVPYVEYRIVNIKGQERIIRLTYIVNGSFYANKIYVKLAQLLSKLFIQDIGGTAIVISFDNVKSGTEHMDSIMFDQVLRENTKNMKRIF
ncbi:exosortase A [Thalassotalea sp. SU-HH00458]|uniref:exosortase A n=1 Tax=Thalassotalea sp. SU-HH00458 TaxID=3127657 RepID=UPI0031022CF8